MPKKPLKQAIIDAADWLSANPERHIRGELAIDDKGLSCDVSNPNAQCFCAVGRVAHEYGLSGTVQIYADIDRALRTAGATLTSGSIYRANDSGMVDENLEMVCVSARPGSPEAIGLLRQIAGRIEQNETH